MEGEGWREGKDDCYTYSDIIQWHHSTYYIIT